MKKTLLAVLVAATPFAAYASPENYTLDPTHTYPHFAVDHLGVSTMWGRFGKTTGKFMLDKVAKKASIELVVETASIDTGDNVRGNRPRARDEHLRTADFFNVQEFPTMTYKSTNVKFAGENPSEIEGQLTLLGVTKPLALKVDRSFVNQIGDGNDRNNEGAASTTTLSSKLERPLQSEWNALQWASLAGSTLVCDHSHHMFVRWQSAGSLG